MLKIGFIDHFIDQWHAHNYPDMIRRSPQGDQFEITLAYAATDPPGKMTIGQWCNKMNVTKADSIEQVVEQCDCLLVLSPDDGNQHEALSDLPLRSGKPVYIDKPFAMRADEAGRMIDKAAAHNTPMFSSSALRFDSTLRQAIDGPLKDQPANFVATRSGACFDIYGVHHLEIIHMILGNDAKRVIQTGNNDCSSLTIDFGEGRRALAGNIPGHPGHPWQTAICYGEQNESKKMILLDQMTDFFDRFIEAVLNFYITKQPPVDPRDTLAIVESLEAGMTALAHRDQWVDVRRGC